jgi:hypothetical protein
VADFGSPLFLSVEVVFSIFFAIFAADNAINKEMKDKLKLLSPALVVVALLAIACCLLIYERALLWKVQELNLFLDTPLFLKQQMVSSGWLLTWLGCYFTEFFYHPALGVTLLTLWWAALLLVIWRTFRIPVRWTAVLLIPLAAIVIMNMDLGYWVYYLKLRGNFFVAAIGTTLAVGAVWLFRLLSHRSHGSHRSILSPLTSYLSPLYIFISTGVLYPLIGFYGLLAALLMGVLLWRIQGYSLTSHLSPLTSKLIGSIVAILSIVFWPLFYYNYVFCQTGIQNIWCTGLPLFVVDKELPNFYIPYYVLVASLVCLALMYGWWKNEEESGNREAFVTEKDARKKKTEKGKTKTVKIPVRWLLIHVALVAIAGYSIHRFWFKDLNFHKELRMEQCMENLDWEGVLAVAAADAEEPTRAIVMMRNLALFRVGRQGDEMYRYIDGSKSCQDPVPVRMMQVCGYSMYYNYGIVNYCHRWCLEQGVEFGFRAEYLKYLMRCALVNGEHQEARKYASLLKHTRYHKAWAEKYERFIGQPNLLKANAEFSPIFHLMTGGDVLGTDQMMAEKFIMERFLKGYSDDNLYKEQSLIAAMWQKDIQLFWPRFFDYAQSHSKERMPVHYQEAAYLYGNLEHEVDISKMPFDDQVKRDYAAFMDLANNATSESEEVMRPIFFQRFGHTFYYNYFFVHDLYLY